MIRPLTAAGTAEVVPRTGFLSLRPAEGAGERASNEAVEQQGVAVQQVAVVAFGNGVYSATTSDTIPPEPASSGVPSSATYQRPSSPPSSASSESLTEAAIRAELAAADAKAAGIVPETARAASAPSSLSIDELSEQIAAKTFITHTARPVQGDPEATLQKLLRMRDTALEPPASVADLAIATAAAIRINRLVRDRYAAEQAAMGGPPPSSRPTLPPVKA